jgi:CDP-glucose 4,6-dehydratase
LENLVSPRSSYWSGRSVLITGHTGFKGGWLAIWLHELGAKVHGFALNPPTAPNLFDVARVGSLLASDTRADLADLSCLTSALRSARPETIFHLAAQPLVREGYRDPLGTWVTNAIGTAHVLEAARATDSVRAVVLITTDKVYEDRELHRPYRESDPLGGRDPYSASKAAAEIVAASYRSSFFSGEGHPARVATARAGNVIGGADWASDRLIPDCLRAFDSGQPVRLRYPQAVRPWQHVLEPLAGYVLLAERLDSEDGQHFATAWNFGPDGSGNATVVQVATLAAQLWGEGASVELAPSNDHPHEAQLLTLDATRARTELDWSPRWSLLQALEQTVLWHRAWKGGADMLNASRVQIERYEAKGAS